MNEALFSLDIGTRTVVGVVSVLEGDQYRVIDYEIKDHPDRAMYDGQIHDISKVTEVVSSVKETLEDRNNLTFKSVAIAAAGRALKTEKISVERELEPGQTITQEVINNVEMEAIQEAQSQIEVDKRTGESRYYCVGYNVCNYYIDGVININPKDHRGNTLKVELIATFLPHIVVDSLYTVVDRVGLEVLNMTLEPIAAINVAIPQNLRLLNLALVDVGAGTSDIAITKEGTVISFGMVASAGDRFTEEIAKSFLLDFDQAEKLKVSLNHLDVHTYTDIIGMTHEKTTEEIIEPIKPAMIQTAEMVAKQILEFNEKSPSAVFCIGGGCQVPGFTDLLAAELELPKERVVIKPVETLDKISFDGQALKGPEFITPLGIGVTAIKEKENDFLQIMVNDKSVRLFNSKVLTVSDALILVGYHARALLPERGRPLAYTMNNRSRVLKGGHGTPSRIFVNGSLAALDYKLKNKDVVHVEAGEKGSDAKMNLNDLLRPFEFVFNDERLKSKHSIRVNDLTCDLDYDIQSGDEISYEEMRTLSDLMLFRGIDSKQVEIYVNGEIATGDRLLQADDIVRTRMIQEMPDITEIISEEVIQDIEVDDFVIEEVEQATSEEVKPVIIESYNYELIVNGQPVSVKGINRKMVFVDVFEYIDFDISKPQGILELTLNGQKANYREFLKNGDVIEIYWRQMKGM
ncbi:cell division protein FtsA [Acidaminobacter sp. JC074]|uniref:cell division protein FtsA n=1 Tax=Acidaminobacter sp. JC074 TaxID=2530199 RepID=UPI001F0DA715|nr:cell division FtsA domain-containing protein [Acidaminobacter sp. JC074]MCH4889169.1 cell division protein FtsA [Acidaminobacter sp. JC074]